MIVEIFQILCGVALATTGSLTFWPVHNWWDFYIPIVLAIAGYIAGLALTCLNYTFFSLVINKKKEYNKVSKWARFWFTQGLWYINTHAGARCKVKGAEKLPKGQRFVAIVNHRSKFDSMLISQIFYKYDIAFITKKSNTKIPWGGRLMNGLCYMPIDRDNLLQSLSQFKRGAELIKAGACSVGVFPEGTRQHDAVIGEFHEGAFNIAIKSGAPIVVITTHGTHNISKRFPRITKCSIEIVGVIPHEEICDKPARAVSDMVHQLMYDNLVNDIEK